MAQQSKPDNGYNLASPQETQAAPTQTQTPAPAPPAHEQTATTGAPAHAPLALGQNDLVVAAIILGGLALAFFLVRSGLRSHLIAGKASPSAAGNAGWALFAFLLSLATMIVFGLIGNLWLVLPFGLPMAGLVLVTFIIFIVLFRGARHARR